MGLGVCGVRVEGKGRWVGIDDLDLLFLLVVVNVDAIGGGAGGGGADTTLVEGHGGGDGDGFTVGGEEVVANVFDEEAFTLEEMVS